MTNIKESTLYPIVEKWLSEYHRCFKTAKNKGLKYTKIDVIGIRDVGGELSGEIETIAIEVKKESEPFAKACGQTLGYKVYANRIYLAVLKEEHFNDVEIRIASHLGIGLILIQNKTCNEILSSPYYNPMMELNFSLLERLALGKCQLCGSFFEIGNFEKNRHSNLTGENIEKALSKERGIMFWNREVADRKLKMGIGRKKDDKPYERRFICPDCLEYVIKQLIE